MTRIVLLMFSIVFHEQCRTTVRDSYLPSCSVLMTLGLPLQQSFIICVHMFMIRMPPVPVPELEVFMNRAIDNKGKK